MNAPSRTPAAQGEIPVPQDDEIRDVSLPARIYGSPLVAPPAARPVALELAARVGPAMRQRRNPAERRDAERFMRELLAHTPRAAEAPELAGRWLAEKSRMGELFWRPWLLRGASVQGLEHWHAARAGGRGAVLVFGHILGAWTVPGILGSGRPARVHRHRAALLRADAGRVPGDCADAPTPGVRRTGCCRWITRAGDRAPGAPEGTRGGGGGRGDRLRCPRTRADPVPRSNGRVRRWRSAARAGDRAPRCFPPRPSATARGWSCASIRRSIRPSTGHDLAAGGHRRRVRADRHRSPGGGRACVDPLPAHHRGAGEGDVGRERIAEWRHGLGGPWLARDAAGAAWSRRPRRRRRGARCAGAPGA